jgi:hypothetical protein
LSRDGGMGFYRGTTSGVYGNRTARARQAGHQGPAWRCVLMPERLFTLPDRCLWVDLEVDPGAARISAFAAMAQEMPEALTA